MQTTTVVYADPTTKNICSTAGALLPATIATNARLAEVIDAAYPHLATGRIHTPGRVITALATALCIGGDDISDINLLTPLRHHNLVDTLASTATAYRRITELAAENPMRLLAAMGKVRRDLFSTLSWANPLHRASIYQPLFIDIDATIITTHSVKDGAAATFKRSFGYHPLLAIADYGPDIGGEVLACYLRAGNAGSNTAEDHEIVLDQALTALGGNTHHDGLGFGKRLVVRCDGGGGSKQFINHCNQQGFGYIIGMRTIGVLVDIITLLPDELIYPLPGGDQDEFVADVTHYIRRADLDGTLSLNLADYPKDMRFIIRVSYPAEGAQPTEDEIFGRRIQLCVTNLHGYSADSIDRMYYKRGRAEQRIRDVKDTGLAKLPMRGFNQNQIWAIIASTAHSLIVWTGLLLGTHRHIKDCYTTTGNHRWWLWQPKTLRARMLTIAAKTTSSARKRIIRFDGACPWATTITQLLTTLTRR